MVRDMFIRSLKQLVSVMLRTEGIGGRVGQTEDEGLAARGKGMDSGTLIITRL